MSASDTSTGAVASGRRAARWESTHNSHFSKEIDPRSGAEDEERSLRGRSALLE